jgi:recombinational DNA repair protein (RecF pathway)
MIEWRDEGAVLAVRPHGENAAIVEVFTAAHGRHAGVVRGGTGRRMAPVLQPGTQVEVVWRARLADHLGAFTVEPLRSRAALVMSDRLALAGLNAVAALLAQVLPEREAHPGLYAQTVQVLDLLGQEEVWPLAYLRWEMALLEEMGFGLDLSVCAATGGAGGPGLCLAPDRAGGEPGCGGRLGGPAVATAAGDDRRGRGDRGGDRRRAGGDGAFHRSAALCLAGRAACARGAGAAGGRDRAGRVGPNRRTPATSEACAVRARRERPS